jgi:hypothetical protein
MPPVLITGPHRSGTTWVGHVLARAGLLYLDEPFNIDRDYKNILHLPHWFLHLTSGNQDRYHGQVRALDDVMALGPQIRAAARDKAKGDDPSGRMLTGLARLSQQGRLLVKDPIALASAPWLADRYQMRVVLLTRHPAAFAASIQRLGWRFDFSHLLAQDELVRAHMGGFVEAMRRHQARPGTLIEEAALLWACLNSLILDYRREHPHWHHVRHEDLCRDPLGEFSRIFDYAGRDFSAEARKDVEASSSPDNPVEAPDNAAHVLARDSRSLAMGWRGSLASHEVELVRETVGDVGRALYPDQDW